VGARLLGKVALVTGAGSGIGAAIAQGFAREGATVYRSDLCGEATHPTRDVVFKMDVADPAQWREALRGIVASQAKLDILVNNAGIASYQSLGEFDEEEWQRTMAVNSLGPALGIREVLPHMLRAQQGSIINVSSIYGERAVVGEAAYHASKAALLGITRNAAATYSEHGVRVNALLPGLVTTPMTTAQDAVSNAALVAATPMKRAARPSELVGPAVFLASDEASFVTGVALPVDGGFLAV
jgi:NAD(P)-dependent dehydrogenase (short-subunit alcohol dehydrogenase family)